MLRSNHNDAFQFYTYPNGLEYVTEDFEREISLFFFFSFEEKKELKILKRFLMGKFEQNKYHWDRLGFQREAELRVAQKRSFERLVSERKISHFAITTNLARELALSAGPMLLYQM